MAAELDILRQRAWHLRRSPDWRWKLARAINDRPKQRFRGAESEDPYVEDAMAIQQVYTDHQSADELAERLAGLGPTLEAYSFWTENHDKIEEDKTQFAAVKEDFRPLSLGATQTAEIEAYILSGASFEAIAGYVPLRARSIEAYEKIFFDVRDRLHLPTWVAANAIGPLQQVGPLTLIPNLIRAYGYYGRSITIARQVACTFNEMALQSAGTDPDRVFASDLRSTSAMRAALAIRMVGFNYNTFDKIVELHNESLETAAKIQSQTNQSTDVEQKYLDALDVVTKQIQWGYGEAPTNLAEYRQLAESGLKVVPSNELNVG